MNHTTKTERRACQRPNAPVRYIYRVTTHADTTQINVSTRELAAWTLRLYREVGMIDARAIVRLETKRSSHITTWTWTHPSAWDHDTWQFLRANDIILRSPSGYYMRERDRVTRLLHN